MKRKVLLPLVALVAGAMSVQAENWMNRLPDDTYISVVSIPGSHDSATGCGWADGHEGLGKSFAQTQDLDLGAQWAAGVRAFDLRPCKHEDGHLHINHGIVATNKRFDDALYELRDSLIANPSEFVIVHVMHETDAYSGSEPEGNFNNMLLDILKSDELKDYFVGFNRKLTVKDVRGKMLVLSRAVYTSGNPIGGIIEGWSHSTDWTKQTAGKIKGPNSATGSLYMQDFYNPVNDGDMDKKLEAIRKMLDYSTTMPLNKLSALRWIVNSASGYCETMFGFPTSDGYRKHAASTSETILDYLATHEAGPMGEVMIDYVGVDKSGGIDVKGLELVRAVIDNNFKYLQDMESGVEAVATDEGDVCYYSLTGSLLDTPQSGINLVRYADGSVRKVLYK